MSRKIDLIYTWSPRIGSSWWLCLKVVCWPNGFFLGGKMMIPWIWGYTISKHDEPTWDIFLIFMKNIKGDQHGTLERYTKKNCLWNPTMKPFWFLRNPEWCVILSTLSKISSSSCTVAASSPGGPRAGSPQLHLHVGLSENSVPLHPMVNDHYPY
jgi:hypothetical protein